MPIVSGPGDDAAADQVLAAKRLRLGSTLRAAHGTNPDQAARVVRAYRAAGIVPPGQPHADLDRDVAATAAVNAADPDALLRDHPHLANWLLDQANAQVAHDDIAGLRDIERAARAFAAGQTDDPLGLLPRGFRFDPRHGIVEAGTTGMARVYGGLEELDAELRRRADRMLADEIQQQRQDARLGALGIPVIGPLAAGAATSAASTLELLGAQEWDRIGAEVAASSSQQSPGLVNDVLRGVGGISADIPLMLTGAGLVAKAAASIGKITRADRLLSAVIGAGMTKKAATAATVAASVQPLAVREGVTQGADHGTGFGALAWAIETVIPGAFGRTGVQRALLPEAVGSAGVQQARRATVSLLRESGLQGGEEAMAELAHAIHEVASGANPRALDADQLARRLVVAGAVGGLAGGVFNLPDAIARKREGDALAIHQAMSENDRLRDLVARAQAAQTTTRAPDQVAQLIVQAQGGTDGTVLFQAADWVDHWQDQGRDPAQAAAEMGVDPGVYSAAMAGDGMVPVSVAAFATRITDADAALLDKARRRADGMSGGEARAAAEALRTDLERDIAAAAQAPSVSAAPGNDITALRDEIAAQFRAIGRSDRQADADAALMATMLGRVADRAGTTARDEFTRYFGGVAARGDPGIYRNGERIGVMDALLEKARAGEIPQDGDIYGPTLGEFLRARGGVRDDGTELATIEADRAGGIRRPGQRSLINPEGMTLDEAREAALDAGYAIEDSVNGIIVALRDESQGVPIYSTARANEALAAERDTLLQLRAALEQAGLDLSRATIAEMRRALAQGAPPAADRSLDQGPRNEEEGGQQRISWDAPALPPGTSAGADPRVAAFFGRQSAIDAMPGDSLSAIAKGYVEQRFPSFDPRGATVSTPTDAAALFAVLRSPFVERLSWMLVDEPDGRVVGGGLHSVGDLSSSEAFSSPSSWRLVKQAIDANRGKQLRLYVAHNHPSGDPAPSAADMIVYASIAKNAARDGVAFSGLVLNGDRFSLIRADGQGHDHVKTVPYRVESPWWAVDPSGLPRISEPSHAAALARLVRHSPDAAVLLYVNAKKAVQGVAVHPGFPSAAALDSGLAEHAVDDAVVVAGPRAVAEWSLRGGPKRYPRALLDVIQLNDDGTFTSVRSQDRSSFMGTIATLREGVATSSGVGYNPSHGEQSSLLREAHSAAGPNADRSGRGPVSDGQEGQAPPGRKEDALGEGAAPTLFQAIRVMPRGDSLAFDDLLRQWRKAHGDRTPVRGDKDWLALQEKSRRIEAARGAAAGGKGYEQSARGQIHIGPARALSITLLAKADPSTFIHELGHAYLEILGDRAADVPALAADLAIVRAHLGVADGQAIAVEQHEVFARSFEAYLMEGKAPSAALRGVFARFKGWLLSIYRTLRNLDVALTPELRAVFDRALASEDEIARAAARVGTAPVFASADEMGVEADRYAAYVTAVQRSRDAADDLLRTELMREELAAAREARAAERIEVRAMVEAQANAEQGFRMLLALQDGVVPDGVSIPDGAKLKLDRDELVERFGERSLAWLPGPRRQDQPDRPNKGRRVYAVEGGMALQEAAILFGYRDADAMWEALANLPDRAQTVEQRTDAEMNRRHPDPLYDGNLRETADAMLADASGEVLAAEIAALERKTGEHAAPAQVVAEVARQQVARMRVRDLRPEAYRTAAAKAAREALGLAARSRDAAPEERAAIDAEIIKLKQREQYNRALLVASQAAAKRSEQWRAHLRRYDDIQERRRLGRAGGWEFTASMADGSAAVFDTETEAMAEVAMGRATSYERTNGYLEAIDAIMEGLDLKRASLRSLRRRETLRAWIERQAAAGEEVEIPDAVVADLGRRSWSDLTATEQEEAIGAIKRIATAAKLKNRLSRLAGERSLDDARRQIVAAIEANSRGTRRARQPGWTVAEKAADAAVRFLEAHRKDSFVAREMDGDRDGGVVWDFFIRPRNEAADAEAVTNAEDAAIRDVAMRAWGKGLGARRETIPGTTLRLTTQQRIAIACNWGNAEGRQRVLMYLAQSGHAEGDVQAVLSSLDEADIELVRETWKQLDRHWPAIRALEQRTTGVAPDRVDPVPFVIANSRLGRITMAGGYYPLRYDARLSSKTGDLDAAMEAKEGLRAAMAASQTRRGHTKQRARDVRGLALRLDFGVVNEHLAEVIHDLTHREMLRDQSRLLRDKDIAQAIIAHHGRGALDQLVATAADIAIGDRPARAGIDPYVRALRKNISAATFGFNLSSALVQITGFSQSLARVGPGRLLAAVARVFRDAASAQATATWVQGRSAFMRTRAQSWAREVAEVNRRADVGGWVNTMRRWGYYPMTKVQQAVDTVTWLAAYDAAMATSAGSVADAERRAIAIADQTVIDTQGSGRIGDLAGIQRGGELTKVMTTFYSYFSVTYNLQRAAVRSLRADDPMTWLRAGTDTLLIWALPAYLTATIQAWLRGDGGGEDDDRWKALVRNQASYGLGMLAGVRELSGAIEGGFGYQGPAGLRGFQVLNAIALQVRQGEPDAAAVKAAVAGGGLLGLPAVQVNRLVDAWGIAVETGEADTAFRAAVFGRPRK